MIEESGKVVALEGDYVWVETMREAACNACTAKSGCGQSVLEKAALGKKHHIRALSTLKVELGEEVVIGIEEPVILFSAVIIYLLPLISLFAAVAVAVTFWGGSDVVVGVSGLAGLSLGLLAARWYSYRNRFNQRYQPVILRAPNHQQLLRHI